MKTTYIVQPFDAHTVQGAAPSNPPRPCSLQAKPKPLEPRRAHGRQTHRRGRRVASLR